MMVAAVEVSIKRGIGKEAGCACPPSLDGKADAVGAKLPFTVAAGALGSRAVEESKNTGKKKVSCTNGLAAVTSQTAVAVPFTTGSCTVGMPCIVLAPATG